MPASLILNDGHLYLLHPADCRPWPVSVDSPRHVVACARAVLTWPAEAIGPGVRDFVKAAQARLLAASSEQPSP